MSDEKTGQWLERELSKAPDYIKSSQQALSARGSRLVYAAIEFGEEYSTMYTCTVTDTPGSDEDIDKWLERIEEKKEERKAAEKRLEKQKTEYTFKGKELKSVTDEFIRTISSANSSIISLSGFDMKA
jgi:hypothetical protein